MELLCMETVCERSLAHAAASLIVDKSGRVASEITEPIPGDEQTANSTAPAYAASRRCGDVDDRHTNIACDASAQWPLIARGGNSKSAFADATRS